MPTIVTVVATNKQSYMQTTIRDFVDNGPVIMAIFKQQYGNHGIETPHEKQQLTTSRSLYTGAELPYVQPQLGPNMGRGTHSRHSLTAA